MPHHKYTGAIALFIEDLPGEGGEGGRGGAREGKVGTEGDGGVEGKGVASPTNASEVRLASPVKQPFSYPTSIPRETIAAL